MEPIGICGGGFVALVLLMILVFGVAGVAGALVLLLAKLGVIVNRLGKPEERGESDQYTLEQSNVPADHKQGDRD